jgi:hypothetical protein
VTAHVMCSSNKHQWNRRLLFPCKC